MKNDWSEKLHTAGLKATPSRLALLNALSKSKKPVTIEELRAKLTTPLPDLVTIYRALKEFVKAELVEQIDFQHGHAHFELVRPENHHHHVICKSCDTVEDIREISLKIPKLKNFTIINHSLEFYGICKTCSA